VIANHRAYRYAQGSEAVLFHGLRYAASGLEMNDNESLVDPGFSGAVMDNRITIDPAICHGKPCVRGLRYPVETVLEWLAGGMSIEEILADYEDLSREDIQAVLAYAARLAHVNRIEKLVA